MGLHSRIPALLLTALMAVASAACKGDSGPVSPTPTTRDAPAVPTWSLSGLVTERFQAVDLPVPGATVSIAEGPDTGRSIVTNNGGNYEFNGLEQGDFTVRATGTGYELSSQVVELRADRRLDFALRRVSRPVTFAFDGGVGRSDSGTGIPLGARVSGTFTISANTPPTTPQPGGPVQPRSGRLFRSGCRVYGNVLTWLRVGQR